MKSGFGSRKRVTLSEVAELANVSPMTVSKVIRNTGHISVSTRKRVQESIEELGYVPNRLAGSLSSQATSLVAVIIPSISDIIFAEVLAGINNTLRSRGLQTFIGASDFDPDTEDDLIRTMLAWQPAGLIITGGVKRSPSIKRILGERTCPIIQIWDTDSPAFDVSVGFSHIAAGSVCASHFHERGFRRVGYVGAQLAKDLCAGRRFLSFREQLTPLGVSIEVEIDEDAPRQASTGWKGTRRLLERIPNLEAIYYLNDTMALGGMRYLHDEGIAVPEEIAVAGFNGSSLSQSMVTDLTTVDVPRYQVGETAASALVDLIDGKHVPKTINVEIHLVDRGST